MKDIELKLLSELIKNSRRSDRELAKALGVSQPTVTRTRSKLEKEGYIKEYTALPDFAKLGYELLAITFASVTSQTTKEQIEQLRKIGREAVKDVAFESVLVVRGMGLRHQVAIMSFHKDYSDFLNFKRMIGHYPFIDVSDIESFLAVSSDSHYKFLTFSTIAAHLSGKSASNANRSK